MKINDHYMKGFTLVEVLMVTLIIGMLAVIAAPGYVMLRSRTIRSKCLANLSQLDAAKQHWALEHGRSAPEIPTYDDLNPYIRGDIHQLRCPAGETSYEESLESVGLLPQCPNRAEFPDHALPPPRPD